MKYNCITIGQNIKKLRTEKKWTQQQLADELGKKGCPTERKKVIKIEQGSESSITLPVLFAICELFECDIEFLLGKYNDCKTYDDQYIHDITGLSHYSIQQLKHFNSDQFPTGKQIITLLNWFLQDPRFTHQLTSTLAKYCDKMLAYQKGRKTYHSESFISSKLAKGSIAAEIALRENGTVKSTISDQKLSTLCDLKDIAHLQVQRSFDNVVDCLVFNHCKKNGCDIDGTY